MAERTDPIWYAVHTRPLMEQKASGYLSRQGYKVFYPFTREKRYVGRKVGLFGKAHAGRLVVLDRPFFSRYIFVGLTRTSESLFDVNETFGVSTVVHIGGEPLQIPHKVIDRLMALTDDDGLVKPPAEAPKEEHWFKGRVGDQVEFNRSSPFYGLCAELSSVAHLDKRGEISIFLTMFGATHEVSAPVTTVAKVTAA